MALGSYVAGKGTGDAGWVSLDLDVTATTNHRTEQTTMQGARKQLLGEQRRAAVALDDTKSQVRRNSVALQRGRADLADAVTAPDRTVADEAGQQIEFMRAALDLEATRGLSQVIGVDFPLVVLDAYWKAAQSQPDCGIQW